VQSRKGDKLKNDRFSKVMTIERIQDLDTNTNKPHLRRGACKTHLYTKPYTKRVDALCMPLSYQPPRFQQFDGKGNPKQYAAYFVKTYNNAGTGSDLMIK